MQDIEIIDIVPSLPPRAPDGHKGSYGHVLVVGGSRGMIGAPALAGSAALRGGAGLVTIAAPETVQLHVAQLCPCATSAPLACNDYDELTGESVRDSTFLPSALASCYPKCQLVSETANALLRVPPARRMAVLGCLR